MGGLLDMGKELVSSGTGEKLTTGAKGLLCGNFGSVCDAPKPEEPKVEPPKVETPKVEAQKPEEPKTEQKGVDWKGAAGTAMETAKKAGSFLNFGNK